MRKKVSTVVILPLVLLLLVALGACGGSDDKGSDSTGDTGQAKLSGTITIWDQTYKAFPAYTEAVDELDAEFERLHPGVTVEHVAQPAEKFDELVQASFNGRQGPDIMRFRPGGQGVLRWTKGLEKLNDLVTPEMRANLSGWNTVIPGHQDEGDIYGLPYGIIGDVFYYNKKHFKKAGLPTDFQPETWEDVRDAGLKLKAAGIQPLTDGSKDGEPNGLWLSTGWHTLNTPEQALSLAEGEMPWTDDAVVKAIGPEIMMQEAGLFDSDRFTTPWQPDGAGRFGEGKAGMTLGLWSLTAYYGQYLPTIGEDNLGVFFAPGGSYLGSTPVGVLGIPSYGKNKDAARAYLEFFASTPSAQKLYEVGGVLPNDKEVKISPNAPPQERQILETLRTHDTYPQLQLMLPGTVDKAFLTEINEVLQGRQSLEEGLQGVQDVAEQGGR